MREVKPQPVRGLIYMSMKPLTYSSLVSSTRLVATLAPYVRATPPFLAQTS